MSFLSKNAIALAFFLEQLSDNQRQDLLATFDEYPKNIRSQNALEFIASNLMVFDDNLSGELKYQIKPEWGDLLTEHIDSAQEHNYFYLNAESAFAF